MMIYRPEKDTSENTRYNYYVSRVRVRSEHCVGFLKGRWSSLRGLHVQINSQRHVQFASLWIMACIILHVFAMKHEDGIDISQDVFLEEGLDIVRAEQRDHQNEEMGQGQDEGDREVDLLQGRLKREKLKQALFAFLEGNT
jgi:hypothetical protein